VGLVRELTNYNDSMPLFITWMSEDTWFPFVESDNGNLTGPGFMEAEMFLKAYEDYTGGTATLEAMDVMHRYVKIIDNEDGSVEFVPAGPNEPNTFPVTCVWGIL